MLAVQPVPPHHLPYLRWFRGLKTDSRAFSEFRELVELVELAEESEAVDSVLLDAVLFPGRAWTDFFDCTLSFVDTWDIQLHLL